MAAKTEDRPLTRAAAVQAAYDGGEAFRAGEPVSACPYNPEDSVYADYVAHFWRKGWRIASEHAPDAG